MNIKVIGGCLCVLALGGIFFLHSPKREAPKVVPVPRVIVAPEPPPPPGYVTGRTGDEIVPTPKPPTKPPTKPPALAPKKPLDMSVECRAARAFVAGKSPAELQRDREVYHTTDNQIAHYAHCFPK